MRVVLLAQMDQTLGVHYAIALARRGHKVTAVHVEEPRGEAQRVEELRGVELLAPYAGGAKRPRLHYVLWALADKARGALAPFSLPARALFGRVDRAALERCAAMVEEREPDAVLGLWGLNAYPEVWTLQRRRRRFPVLYDWNTYPLGDEPPGEPGCNAIDKRLAERLEGRVHASERMLRYLRARMSLERGIDVVFPDGFSEVARPRERLALASEQDGEPHVLYHGTWRVRAGGQDDVALFLQSLADDGVHVHFPGAGEAPRRPRLHPYEPFSLQEHVRGAVFRHATQCDACLVVYHAPRPLARYESLLPTRFLSGVASGLPIALPEGMFPACEDFVREHGNGFTFRGAADLKARLADREAMAQLRKRAEALEPRFTLEARLPVLEEAMRRAAEWVGR